MQYNGNCALIQLNSQYLIRQLQIPSPAPRTPSLLCKHLIKRGIYPPLLLFLCLNPHYLNNGNLPAVEQHTHLLYETLRRSQWRFEFLPSWWKGAGKVCCQNTLNRWFRIFKSMNVPPDGQRPSCRARWKQSMRKVEEPSKGSAEADRPRWILHDIKMRSKCGAWTFRGAT